VLSLAAKNERSAGTPLYIVSVLIEFRDGKIRVGDIENLPGDAVTLWKEIYFPRLSADEKTVLYCLKLLKLIYTPPFKEIVSKMWKNIFERRKADLFTAIESLERKIWLKEAENTYSSFDIQLEAVEIGNEWFEDFETFVRSNELEQKYQSHLFFNLSYYYSEKIKESKTKVELSSNLKKAIEYIEEAIVIYRELGLKAEVATSLNNASNRYSNLAALEETKEGRKELLDNAIGYIEEAIVIRRELGMKADVAMSLNNASNLYSALAALEETKEGRKELLDNAIEYIEGAIVIYRELGMKAGIATSLNNASTILYSGLAALEETKEGRKELLDNAIGYIEEAIGIYRELGMKADVATSLNNASGLYSALAALGETKEGRKELLDKAIEYTEEAIVIKRVLGMKAGIAASLNNASNLYSDLAALGETKEGRKELLDKAIEYIEEAIVIYRELGMKAEVATSLNNASNFHSDLAALEEKKEGRKELLDKAIEYIEEAIGIRRELGMKADVAMSLNNASNLYSDLAALEEKKKGRKELLDNAIGYIEEAIGIYRELGMKAEVATSLNNASNRYSDLAALEEKKEGRKELLDNTIGYIEEAIGIRRELGLKADLADSLANSVIAYSKIIEFDAKYFVRATVNCDEAIKIFLDSGMVYKAKLLMPYGIQFHETLYKIDSGERHKQKIEFYKSIGS
jgi:tetratricopeptide (TPR) repeat protein